MNRIFNLKNHRCKKAEITLWGFGDHFTSYGWFGPKDFPDYMVTNEIKKLIKDYKMTQGSINHGNCDNFAEDLVDVIGGEVIETNLETELPAHFFVLRKGKYYDAETINGVDSPFDLPIFLNYIKNKA